jgi:hypothetical protein
MEENFLQMLRQGVANVKIVKWPGTELDVALRVLSDQDHLEANIAADTVYKTAGISVSMQNVQDYEAEKNVQLLFRAIVDPETRKPFCKSISEFRKLLSMGIRDALMEQVSEFQRECSPDPVNMPAEEFDNLLSAVKKNAERTLSNVSNIILLKKLISILVSHPETSQAANGSTSSLSVAPPEKE